MITKSMRTGSKQAAWTVSEQVLSSLTIFVSGILLARATTKEDFALYILGLNIVMIVIGFQRALILTPYAILYGQHKTSDSGRQYRFAAFAFQNLFAIFNAVIFSFVILYLYITGNHSHITFYICLFIFYFGQLYLYYFKFTLIAQLDVRQNFILCGIIYLVTITLLFALYALHQLDTQTTYAVSGGAVIVVVLFYWLYFRSSLQRVKQKDMLEYVSQHWHLGKWIVGSNVGFIISSQMFPWLLLMFWDKTSVAELGIVLSATRILAPAVQGISSFLLPKMTAYIGDPVKLVVILKQLLGIMALAALLLTGGGYLFGEQLIEMVYSSKYSGLGSLITLGLLFQGINLINMPIDAALNALRRTDTGFKSLIVGALVAVIIGVPLTWESGVIGALFGMLLSGLSSLVYRAYILKKLLERLM